MLVVEAGGADFFEIDRVGLAQDVELFRRDLAGDADGEARARETDGGRRRPRGRPSSRPERAHLVLEQFAQRLDQLHVHALGQAADIVVRLDRHRRAAGERHRFDHVGIERALREELDRAAPVGGDLCRLALERLDEQPADRLALGLGVGDAGERAEEGAAGLDMDERDVEMVAEQPHDFLALARAHQAVIDEHAGELVADRLVDQHRGDRRNRRRRRGRRSPGPCRPGRGSPRAPRARNAAIVQSLFRPATPWTKLPISRAPSGVWTTSGWNIRP